MIPISEDVIDYDFDLDPLPSTAYFMNTQTLRIVNNRIDEQSAMQQAAYWILNTELGEHPIYPWTYGIETADLFGQPTAYACAEIQMRVSEALLRDDRFLEVYDFAFNTDKQKTIVVSAIANTVFGEIDVNRAVDI